MAAESHNQQIMDLLRHHGGKGVNRDRRLGKGAGKGDKDQWGRRFW